MADSQFRPSSKAKTTRAAGRATLLDRVSAADAARLDAMHADILHIANKTDASDALRKVTVYLDEILQMSVIDKSPPSREPDENTQDRLYVQLATLDCV